ncbi:MAG: AAA family ATPase [Pseudomonadota bacterium]
MYLEFFGLEERPFNITPDPRYLFMSARHAEALAHLVYGVTESDGFIVLTGEVGTGKTTLVRSLLQQMPEEADVALVLNPQLTALEFLAAICRELEIDRPDDTSSCRAYIEVLNTYLLDAHSRDRRTIAVVDEAQNLSAEVLEQIRLLTNLETTRNKLLQIVLIGQPELRELLDRQDLRQLSQRITARYHLQPLDPREAAQYLEHRLKVAGAVREIFSTRAMARIHQLASGIPRLMNLIADRALLGAWSREQRKIDRSMIDTAANEVLGRPPTKRVGIGGWLLGIAALIMLALTATLVMRDLTDATRNPVEVSATGSIAREPSPPTEAPVDLQTAALDAPPDTPQLADWLEQHAEQTGTQDAFAALFDAWRLPLTRNGPSACEQASASGLRCYADSSAFLPLVSLDRPAIVNLVLDNGVEHQVVLRGWDGSKVSLSAPSTDISVAAGEFSRFWYGEFLLLWQPPPSSPNSALAPGMRGPAVLWLRRSLASIVGAPIPPMDSDRYDNGLETQVRAYQASRRLKVDGLVGERTQMMINAEVGQPGVPKLRDTVDAATLANRETQ